MKDGLTDVIDYTKIGYAQIEALVVQYAFSVVGALIILFIGWLLTHALGRWSQSALSRVRGLDATVAGFVSNFLRYALLAIVIVMVLGQFGVQTTSIVAALGAVGLAIGLALQGTLQNIAAGSCFWCFGHSGSEMRSRRARFPAPFASSGFLRPSWKRLTVSIA